MSLKQRNGTEHAGPDDDSGHKSHAFEPFVGLNRTDSVNRRSILFIDATFPRLVSINLADYMPETSLDVANFQAVSPWNHRRLHALIV